MEQPAPTRTDSVAAPRRTSLAARLANVFATPGEVFDEVKTSPPRAAHWVVPGLLSCLVGVISVWVLFSQDDLRQQMMEQQAKAMEKKLEQLPPAERERARQTMSAFTGSTLVKAVAAGGAVFVAFAQVLVVGTVLWLLGKSLFQADATYLKALEVSGLASMISVLGGIVSLLLVLITGRLTANLGPGLLLREFDANRISHLALAALNCMTLWYVAVLALGLARLSGVSWGRASAVLLVLWALYHAGSVGLRLVTGTL
jgi:hypothetical protein